MGSNLLGSINKKVDTHLREGPFLIETGLEATRVSIPCLNLSQKSASFCTLYAETPPVWPSTLGEGKGSLSHFYSNLATKF